MIAGTNQKFVVPLEWSVLVDMDKTGSSQNVQQYLTGMYCKGVSSTFGKWAGEGNKPKYDYRVLNLTPVEDVITINCEDIDVISSPIVPGWMYNNPTWYGFQVASAGVYAVSGSIYSAIDQIPSSNSLGDIYYYGTWVAVIDPDTNNLTEDAEGTKALLNFIDGQSSYIGGQCIEEGTRFNPDKHTGLYGIDFSKGDTTGNTATAWAYLSKGYHTLAIAVHTPQNVEGVFDAEGRDQKRYAAVTNLKLTLRKFPGLNCDTYNGNTCYRVDDWRDYWSNAKHYGRDTSLSSSGECYRLNYDGSPISVSDYQQYLIARINGSG